MVGQSYIQKIVDFDAAASRIMYDTARRTFPFREEVNVLGDRKGGMAVLRLKNRKIAVHSASADSSIEDIEGRIAASQLLKKGSGVMIKTYAGREIVF